MRRPSVAWYFLLIAILGALSPYGAKAAEGDTWGVLTLASRHADREKPYNERNFGAGLEYEHTDDYRTILGTYRNSFYRRSVYVGGTYKVFASERGWWMGGTWLMVSGYETGKFSPIAFPAAGYEGRSFGINFGPILPAVVGLQVKFKID
jgi:hypothetical protein